VGESAALEEARVPKKPHKKKLKQPKPKPTPTFPRPEKGKPDFIRPDPASVRAPDKFDLKKWCGN